MTFLSTLSSKIFILTHLHFVSTDTCKPNQRLRPTDFGYVCCFTAICTQEEGFELCSKHDDTDRCVPCDNGKYSGMTIDTSNVYKQSNICVLQKCPDKYEWIDDECVCDNSLGYFNTDDNKCLYIKCSDPLLVTNGTCQELPALTSTAEPQPLFQQLNDSNQIVNLTSHDSQLINQSIADNQTNVLNLTESTYLVRFGNSTFNTERKGSASENENNDDDILTIALSVILTVILIIGLFVAFLCYRRRIQGKHRTYTDNCQTEEETTTLQRDQYDAMEDNDPVNEPAELRRATSLKKVNSISDTSEGSVYEDGQSNRSSYVKPDMEAKLGTTTCPKKVNSISDMSSVYEDGQSKRSSYVIPDLEAKTAYDYVANPEMQDSTRKPLTSQDVKLRKPSNPKNLKAQQHNDGHICVTSENQQKNPKVIKHAESISDNNSKSRTRTKTSNKRTERNAKRKVPEPIYTEELYLEPTNTRNNNDKKRSAIPKPCNVDPFYGQEDEATYQERKKRGYIDMVYETNQQTNAPNVTEVYYNEDQSSLNTRGITDVHCYEDGNHCVAWTNTKEREFKEIIKQKDDMLEEANQKIRQQDEKLKEAYEELQYLKEQTFLKRSPQIDEDDEETDDKYIPEKYKNSLDMNQAIYDLHSN